MQNVVIFRRNAEVKFPISRYNWKAIATKAAECEILRIKELQS